jgi:hypothetical protein
MKTINEFKNKKNSLRSEYMDRLELYAKLQHQLDDPDEYLRMLQEIKKEIGSIDDELIFHEKILKHIQQKDLKQKRIVMSISVAISILSMIISIIAIHYK